MPKSHTNVMEIVNFMMKDDDIKEEIKKGSFFRRA
jgi:hypothetical protein